jgi:exonuclease SbcD
MRMIHTSDWHLGRTFHGRSLLADQEVVLGALADLAADHRADVVVISGDLYDRAVPSPEAVQCATRILARIRAAGSAIVMISGNHDSAPRLGAFADFLAVGGLHVRSSIRDCARPVLLDDLDGPVAVYALPYLEPDLARGVWELSGPVGHQQVMAEALRQVRSDLDSRAPGTRSVVLAHAFVVGGAASGSERSIAVGGVESVTSDLFDGFDYVALGHLHRAQVIGERIRYSGSPLPYAFSEADQRKGVWLVDLAADGAVEVERLELPQVRRLATVTGALAEVLVSYPHLADAYLSVELTDPVRPLEPMRQLRERFPYVLVAQWTPEQVTGLSSVRVMTGRRTDGDLLVDFVTDARGTAPSARERSLLERSVVAERLVERIR